MRKFLVLLPMTLILAIACGTEDLADIRSYISSLEGVSLEYEYEEEVGGVAYKVQGTVQDSFSHRELLFVNGFESLDRIAVDDALALRLVSQEYLPQLGEEIAPSPALEALQSGQWILDPAGAPLLGMTDTTEESFTTDPLTNAMNITQYLRESITTAYQIGRFNPDSVTYKPSEDPFPHPDRAAGESRFDFTRPPLPKRQDQAHLVSVAHFRKMSFYIRNGQLDRVLEVIDVEGHEDIERARENRRNKFLLELVDAIRQGRTQEPIIERSMSWKIVSVGGSPTVILPEPAVAMSFEGLSALTGRTAANATPSQTNQ